MLPSGTTTVPACLRADHPALAFTRVQGWVYVSSPKNHAQPEGVLVDVSVNRTGRGVVPDVTLAVKLATGADSSVTVIYPFFCVLLNPPVLYACSATGYVPGTV